MVQLFRSLRSTKLVQQVDRHFHRSANCSKTREYAADYALYVFGKPHGDCWNTHISFPAHSEGLVYYGMGFYSVGG